MVSDQETEIEAETETETEIDLERILGILSVWEKIYWGLGRD